MSTQIVTTASNLQILNELFTVIVLITIGFVITSILFKIASSGGAVSGFVDKLKFGVIFIFIVGIIYGLGDLNGGLQATFFKVAGGGANYLINEIDPTYLSKGNKYYGSQNEFSGSGVDSTGVFK